jgi:hypothetical protein
MWDAALNKFVFFQSFSTDGAHGAKFFVSQNNQLYLTIANFGSRHDKRYSAISHIYLLSEDVTECATAVSPNGDSVGSDCATERFKLQGSVPTTGATDWEHFSMNGFDFIAVSEEGDLSRGEASAHLSQVFRLIEV